MKLTLGRSLTSYWEKTFEHGRAGLGPTCGPAGQGRPNTDSAGRPNVYLSEQGCRSPAATGLAPPPGPDWRQQAACLMDRNNGRLGARTVFKIELLPLIRHTVFFRDEGPVFGTPRKKPAEEECWMLGGPSGSLAGRARLV